MRTWEIVMQHPEWCDDCTPACWHLTLYGWDGRRYYVGDLDGVDTPIRRREMPSEARVAELWRAYYADVAETGQDPLGVVFGARLPPKKRVWQVRLAPSVLGVVLTGARRRGRGPWLRARNLPLAVREFCLLQDGGRGDVVELGLEAPFTEEKIRQAAIEIRWQRGRPLRGTVTIEEPASAEAQRRELQRAARRLAEREDRQAKTRRSS